MSAADARGECLEKRLWQRNTMPTISKISTAMPATTMPTIAPVDNDLEGLAAGAAVGLKVNVLKTAINSSTLMDPSPVMGSHPVVG